VSAIHAPSGAAPTSATSIPTRARLRPYITLRMAGRLCTHLEVPGINVGVRRDVDDGVGRAAGQEGVAAGGRLAGAEVAAPARHHPPVGGKRLRALRRERHGHLQADGRPDGPERGGPPGRDAQEGAPRGRPTTQTRLDSPRTHTPSARQTDRPSLQGGATLPQARRPSKPKCVRQDLTSSARGGSVARMMAASAGFPETAAVGCWPRLSRARCRTDWGCSCLPGGGWTNHQDQLEHDTRLAGSCGYGRGRFPWQVSGPMAPLLVAPPEALGVEVHEGRPLRGVLAHGARRLDGQPQARLRLGAELPHPGRRVARVHHRLGCPAQGVMVTVSHAPVLHADMAA
jgi:hypothetical protein